MNVTEDACIVQGSCDDWELVPSTVSGTAVWYDGRGSVLHVGQGRVVISGQR